MLRQISFAIVAAAAALSIFAFAGGAAGTQNDFRFSIIGDRTGSPQPQVYGRVWREIDLLHPDFVINVGDVIQGGNDATAEAEWRAVRDIWQRYGYPLFFTPGNHDVWSPFSKRLYEKMTRRPAQYSFNRQNAHFTILDNSGGNTLDDAQMQFLTHDLEQNADRSPKFVFFHNPAVWLVPLRFQNYNFALHNLARTYHVTAIVSGHSHQFARIEKDGIVYLGVGSSGAHLRGPDNGRGFAAGLFYHHVLATVKGPRVYFTVKEIDGPMGKGRMFRAEDWTESGPKFDPDDPAASEKPAT